MRADVLLVAGAAAGSRSPRAVNLDWPRLVVVVHAAAARAAASDLAVGLRAEGIVARLLLLTNTIVDELRRRDPDVIVVSFVVGTYDLARFCRDVGTDVDRPIVVVLSDPADPAAAVLADDLVVDLLDAGADQVLPAATSARVVAARLRASSRSHPARPPLDEPVLVGDVWIDPAAHLVRIDGVATRIRPIQFQLLLVLARHADHLVRPEQLLAEVWGVGPATVDPRRVRIAISVLRRTLGRGPIRPIIETVTRQGYRLTVPGPSMS